MANVDQDQQLQMAMLKVLAQPPESLLAMFDRLNISWERVRGGTEYICKDDVLIINWRDFREGEETLQKQGPVLKKLMKELESQGFTIPKNPLAGGEQ